MNTMDSACYKTLILTVSIENAHSLINATAILYLKPNADFSKFEIVHKYTPFDLGEEVHVSKVISLLATGSCFWYNYKVRLVSSNITNEYLMAVIYAILKEPR